MSSPAEVIAYYEAKTASIIAKYGPGPRVHFHSGIPLGRCEGLRAEELRSAMHRAQEELLEQVAVLWPSGYLRDRHILDVGCGLGGGALFWAERHRARVTALTNVPAHAALVRTYADAAGVGERVRVVLRDAHEEVEEGTDVVIAVESSAYLARDAWFGAMRSLGHGALLVIVDLFVSDERVARVFDGYWHTSVGPEEEYMRVAAQTGMRLLSRTRLNDRVAPFWDLTVAYSRLELERDPPDELRERLRRSIQSHLWLRNALESGAITYAVLVFGREESGAF